MFMNNISSLVPNWIFKREIMSQNYFLLFLCNLRNINCTLETFAILDIIIAYAYQF